MNRNRLSLSLCLIIVLSLLLGACTPGKGSQTQVTLTVWDQFGGDAQTVAVDEIYANFTKKYPNIKIEREIVSTDQMDQTGRTALASGTGPDIIYADVAAAKEYIDANLILALDTYADEFGWKKRFTDTGLNWTTYKGKLWGLGAESEFVGVWYNKTLFEKEGMQIPQTMAEVLAWCPKAKEKGYVPIAHMGQRPGPLFGGFINPITNYIGVPFIEDMLFKGQGTWEDPKAVAAMKVVYQDMKKCGCFADDVNALKHSDSVDLFSKQKAFLLPIGTWGTSTMIQLTDQEKLEVGIMPWFDMGQGKPRVFTMGMGSAYFASAATKHPKEVAQFLDYLFSDEAVKIWVDQVGVIPPVKIDTSKLTLHPLQEFNIEQLTKGGMGYDVDVLAPQAFCLMLYKGMPEVWDGTKTVEQQMADLQKIWKDEYEY